MTTEAMDVVGEEKLGNCLSSFIDDGSIESHRYYLARRTVLEMLRDRGYDVSNPEIELSLQAFREKYGQNPVTDSLKITALHKEDPSKKTLALFCSSGIVKVTVVRAIIGEFINNNNVCQLILVIQNKITSQASKAVELCPCKVEIFQITELLVNITKHELKPKHHVLTDEQKESLLKQYSIDEKQLPRMSRKDAIARYYGLEKGQIVKVTYSGELTKLHVNYRCVF